MGKCFIFLILLGLIGESAVALGSASKVIETVMAMPESKLAPARLTAPAVLPYPTLINQSLPTGISATSAALALGRFVLPPRANPSANPYGAGMPPCIYYGCPLLPPPQNSNNNMLPLMMAMAMMSGMGGGGGGPQAGGGGGPNGAGGYGNYYGNQAGGGPNPVTDNSYLPPTNYPVDASMVNDRSCAHPGNNQVECNVCNCYFESDPHERTDNDRVAIDQVVMSRVIKAHTNACYEIYKPSQFSWTLCASSRPPAFCRTLGPLVMSDSNKVQQCTAALVAAQQRPNPGYDHYYAASITPNGWSCPGGGTLIEHQRFCTLGYGGGRAVPALASQSNPSRDLASENAPVVSP